MPKANDLEGEQDQGGKHGGQQGNVKPETWPPQQQPNGDEGKRDGDEIKRQPRE